MRKCSHFLGPEVKKIRESRQAHLEGTVDKVTSLGKAKFHFKFGGGGCSRRLLNGMLEFWKG